MDQKATVYIEEGAMNGNISDGGKTIALSKQSLIEYKSYAPSFQRCNEHNIFAFFFW